MHSVETTATTTEQVRGTFHLSEAGHYRVIVRAIAYGQYWGSPDDSTAWHRDGRDLNGVPVLEDRPVWKTGNDIIGRTVVVLGAIA